LAAKILKKLRKFRDNKFRPHISVLGEYEDEEGDS
jgi:hypothetical protein